MTVNTNGNNTPMNPQTDHTSCCVPCASLLSEVRESQLRTEKLVTEFVETMSKNPMFAMMARKFGG